jgi:hypothetical protein
VKGELREFHAGGDHMLAQQLAVCRFHTEFRGEIRLGGRTSKRQTDKQLDVARPAGEFLCLARILDDEGANTSRIGMVDIGRLLARMRVDAPIHRQAELLQMADLRAAGDVEAAATNGDP